MKEYTTVGQTEEYVEVINKSRFIANVKSVRTTEQAADFINEISKLYYDATHNCYAYIIGETAKFSDNGEPSGTAGLPIYETIKKQNLDRVCVVVTRYFGGVKFGAGGLIRAYGGCAAAALNKAEKKQIRLITPFRVILSYNMLKQVKSEIEISAKIDSVEYGENVVINVKALSGEAKALTAKITDITSGRAQISLLDELLEEF